MPRRFLQQQQRTDPGTAAKVDEGPVVLLRAAEDVARLDIAVGVPEVVNAPQRTDGVTQSLQCRPGCEPAFALSLWYTSRNQHS